MSEKREWAGFLRAIRAHWREPPARREPPTRRVRHMGVAVPAGMNG